MPAHSPLRSAERMLEHDGLRRMGSFYVAPDGRHGWCFATPEVEKPLDTLAFWVDALREAGATIASKIESTGDPDARKQLAAHLLSMAARDILKR